MTLLRVLQEVVNSYKTEIGLVRDFALDAHEMLHGKLLEHSKARLAAAEKEELREFVTALDQAIQLASGSNSRSKRRASIVHVKSSSRVGKFITQMTMQIKQQGLVAEMSVSHLVAYQEAFIKDYLYELLIRKREMLRTGGTITFEKVVAHRSITDLVSAIARSEVNQLGQGGLDDIATIFEKKINVSLSEYEKWPELRELSYRRNVIIHNRGRVDVAYRRQVGTEATRPTLTTNLDYVKAAAETVLGFIDFIHVAVSGKFRRKSK